MSLATGHYQLAAAFQALQVHWERTCQTWRDEARREFTEKHWEELETRLPAVLSAIDRLDQVLNRIRQECGE